MRIQLVDTIPDAGVGGVVSFEGPGIVTDILLYFHGTNAAAAHMVLGTDLGGPLIVAHHGGNELGNIVSLSRPQSLITFCEANRGRFVEATGNGVAYEAVLRIPLHFSFDDNGLYIGPNERLQIEVPAFDDTNKLAASDFTCEVQVKIAEAVTRYIPRIHDMRVDLGGMRKERIPESTACLILTAGSVTDPDRIAILRGEQRLLYVDWDAYNAIWQDIFMMDAAPYMTGDLYIDFTDLGRHLGDALGAGQVLELQDGSTDLEMFTYSLDYHVPSRTALSSTYINQELARVETRLRREGIESVMLPVVLPEKPTAARVGTVPGTNARGRKVPRAASGFRVR